MFDLHNIRRLCLLLLAILVVGCTDYVAKMDEDIEAWKADALSEDEPSSSSLARSSSSSMQKSSSSNVKSSSSVEESSSSIVESSSSKVLSSSTAPVSSSSEILMSSCSEKSSSSLFSESSSSKSLGKMTDSRDGQTYRTVTIGTQTWMAQNLNYGTVNSYCFNDDVTKCTKYGRLYTWAAAMDSAGVYSTNGKGCGKGKTCSPTYPVRGVCPDGWHLPTPKEWSTLFSAVGGSPGNGTKLKSTSGWQKDGNGTDAFSFSALPAGYPSFNGNYYDEGSYAIFWSSTEYDDYYANHIYLYRGGDIASLAEDYKGYGFSVRCLKD